MWLVPDDLQEIVMTELLLILDSLEGRISENSCLTPKDREKRPGRIVIIAPMFWFLEKGDLISVYEMLADPR